MEVLVQRVTPTAKMPSRGSEHSAGYDFYADLGDLGGSKKLFPNNRVMVSLGVAMAFDPNFYLRLSPRSGLSYKNGIMLLGGIIDPDYRGIIQCILYNSGDTVLDINHGDRICQGVFLRFEAVELTQVGVLPDSKRGDGGFGSTGK